MFKLGTLRVARLLLCSAIVPALILLPINSVIAQSEDRNSRSYCKNKAQDLTDAHFKGSNISGAVNNAAIGAVLGRSMGNTATGVGLGAAFGSSSNRKEKKEYYQREYDFCMRSNSN